MQYDMESLREVVDYNPETGVFINKKSGRQLKPSKDDGTISVSSKSLKIKLHIKPEKLAWLMMYGTIPSGRKRIYHKNLNKSDNRFSNLGIVTQQELREINEAYLNLTEFLKIIPHPTDQFSYILQYKSNGMHMREVVMDIVVARRKLRRLQLKNAKILTKYCIPE